MVETTTCIPNSYLPIIESATWKDYIQDRTDWVEAPLSETTSFYGKVVDWMKQGFADVTDNQTKTTRMTYFINDSMHPFEITVDPADTFQPAQTYTTPHGI
jgi:hypothetical protein